MRSWSKYTVRLNRAFAVFHFDLKKTKHRPTLQILNQQGVLCVKYLTGQKSMKGVLGTEPWYKKLILVTLKDLSCLEKLKCHQQIKVRVPVNCELLKLRVASCKLLVASHKGCGQPPVEVSGEKVLCMWHISSRHATLLEFRKLFWSMNTSSSPPFQEERLILGLYPGGVHVKIQRGMARPIFWVWTLSNPVFFAFCLFFFLGGVENWRYFFRLHKA